MKKVVENFSREVVDFLINFDLEENCDIIITSLCKIKKALKTSDHIKPITFSKLTGTSYFPQKLEDFLHFLHSFTKIENSEIKEKVNNKILLLKEEHSRKYKNSYIKNILGYEVLYKKKCNDCDSQTFDIKTNYIFNVETEREWNLVYYLKRKLVNPDISYLECKECGESSEREHEITSLMTYLPEFIIFEKKKLVFDEILDLSEYCSLNVLNPTYKIYRQTDYFCMYKRITQ